MPRVISPLVMMPFNLVSPSTTGNRPKPFSVNILMASTMLSVFLTVTRSVVMYFRTGSASSLFCRARTISSRLMMPISFSFSTTGVPEMRLTRIRSNTLEMGTSGEVVMTFDAITSRIFRSYESSSMRLISCASRSVSGRCRPNFSCSVGGLVGSIAFVTFQTCIM